MNKKVGMLLQKSTDTRGVGISSMRKSIYLLKTTPTSCSPHPLATPIHSTHSPQLSSILLTCAKFKVWMTIVESGWNVWVWLVGVVSRRWVESMGVTTGCGFKEIYRFPHTTYPYSSCICTFLQQHPYFFVHFVNVFTFLYIYSSFIWQDSLYFTILAL